MFGIEKWWSRSATGALVVLFLLFGFCVLIYALSYNEVSMGYNEGYRPSQPIPFSHKLHAGQYKMDCRYCHTAVEQSRHASVPSLNICMNCHLNIKVDSPWIQQLRKAYDNNEPVEWQKVHLLPDFVKFNHAPHIKALAQKGNLNAYPESSVYRQSCQTCHGPVEQMEVMVQHKNLSMGWCIECHRREESKDWLNQCSTCHY